MPTAGCGPQAASGHPPDDTSPKEMPPVTTPSNAAGKTPLRGMLRGAVATGLVASLVVAGALWALRGEEGALAGLLGAAVAFVVLLVGLLGISVIVAGHASIAMAGALVVYLGQLILLAAVVLVLRDADWLDGRAFVVGTVATTLLMQVGLIFGYSRARHVLFPHAGEVSR